MVLKCRRFSGGDNCWISHKVDTFVRPRKWLVLLVKLWIFKGITTV